jgi:anti-anti-sigma factor
VIDCTDCGYIDASGLGVLVQISKHLRELRRPMPLVLVGLNDDLLTLLELPRMDQLLPWRDSIEGPVRLA